MNHLFSVAGSFLSNNPMAVYIAAILILVGAISIYLIWFRPPAIHLQKSLRGIAAALEGPADGWPTARERARAAAQENAATKAAWQETEDRVIPLQHGPRTLFVMFGAPRDLWSANKLLGSSRNMSLAEAIPNLLVGLGLLFTFVFLTLALNQATAALLPQAGQATTDITSATRGLLSAAGAKFVTSLAGLFASLVWAVAMRRCMATLKDATEDVLENLGRVISYSGGEMTIFAQLQVARDNYQSAEQHVAIAKLLDEKMGQKLDLTHELLSEAREQSGTFKRFETDLALSLAGAITRAFSPQMDDMTNRLIGAIDSLSEKLQALNHDALQKMTESFVTMLMKVTDTEMSQLREVLEKLANRLDKSGGAIFDGAVSAADILRKAGADLLLAVQQVSTNLATGATSLEGATKGLRDAINDLDSTVIQVSDLGKQGTTFVREALDTSNSVFSRLSSASQDLSAAGGAIERVSSQLSNAVDSVHDMTEEQRAVVTAVRDATPKALESIQQVLNILQQTVQMTASSMAQTKDSMAITATTLGVTISEITTGVSEYSSMLAELHRKLDSQLAKALGSLDKGVLSLDESVEDLAEVLSSRLPKA